MSILSDVFTLFSSPRRRARQAAPPRESPTFQKRRHINRAGRAGDLLGTAFYDLSPAPIAEQFYRSYSKQWYRFVHRLTPRHDIRDAFGIDEFKVTAMDVVLDPGSTLKRYARQQRNNFYTGVLRGMTSVRSRRQWGEVKENLRNLGTSWEELMKDPTPGRRHLAFYRSKSTGVTKSKDLVEMVDEWMLGERTQQLPDRRQLTRQQWDKSVCSLARHSDYDENRRGPGRSLHAVGWRDIEDKFLPYVKDRADELRDEANKVAATDQQKAATLRAQADQLDKARDLLSSKHAREGFFRKTGIFYRGAGKVWSGQFLYQEFLFRGLITGGLWEDWADRGFFSWQRKVGNWARDHHIGFIGRPFREASFAITRRTNAAYRRVVQDPFRGLVNKLPKPLRRILGGLKGVSKRLLLLVYDPISFLAQMGIDVYNYVKDKAKKYIKVQVKKAVIKYSKAAIKASWNFLKTTGWTAVKAAGRVAATFVINLVGAAASAVLGAVGGTVLIVIGAIALLALLFFIVYLVVFKPGGGSTYALSGSTVAVAKVVSPSVIPENLDGGKTAEVTYTIVIKNNAEEAMTITKVVDSKYQIQVDNTCNLVGRVLTSGEQTSEDACTYTIVLQNISDVFIENSVEVEATVGSEKVSDVDSAWVKVGEAKTSVACGWPLSPPTQITQPCQQAHKPPEAVDMGARMHTPVLATMDGRAKRCVVTKQQGIKTPSYGIYIDIENDQYTTRYAHLEEDSGDGLPGTCRDLGFVKKGDTIAYSDNTGFSSGPHLHYEVYRQDTRLCPHESPSSSFLEGTVADCK